MSGFMPPVKQTSSSASFLVFCFITLTAMASLVSRRYSHRLLKSSCSFSIFSPSLPHHAIAKPSCQFHLCLASTPPKVSRSFLSSHENPKNAGSSSCTVARSVGSPNHEKQSDHKSKILCHSFGSSVPILASIRSTKGRYFSAYGYSSSSDNAEILNPSQIKDLSYLKIRIGESLKELIEKMDALKNAFFVLGVAQIGFRSWIAYTHPISSIYLTWSIVSSVIPLWVVIKVHDSLRRVHFSDVEREEGLLGIIKEACSVAMTVNRGILLPVAVEGALILPLNVVRMMGQSDWIDGVSRLYEFNTEMLLDFLPTVLLLGQSLLLPRLFKNLELLSKLDPKCFHKRQLGNLEDLEMINHILLPLKRVSCLAAALSCTVLLGSGVEAYTKFLMLYCF